MLFARPARREPRVDITALIDVAFLLIIFLVVSTTFLKERGLDLELPKAKGDSPIRDEILVVEVSREGLLYFRGEAYDRDDLAAALREALKEAASQHISLKADRAAAHGDVVRAMDAVKESGAKGLSVAVEQGAR